MCDRKPTAVPVVGPHWRCGRPGLTFRPLRVGVIDTVWPLVTLRADVLDAVMHARRATQTSGPAALLSATPGPQLNQPCQRRRWSPEPRGRGPRRREGRSPRARGPGHLQEGARLRVTSREMASAGCAYGSFSAGRQKEGRFPGPANAAQFLVTLARMSKGAALHPRLARQRRAFLALPDPLGSSLIASALRHLDVLGGA